MRTFATTLALSCVLGLGASAAYAVECDRGQGVEVVLDYQSSGGIPLLNIELRSVSERCVDGPSSYTLKGLPEVKFGSARDATHASKLLQELITLGVTSENAGPAIKFAVEAKKRSSAPQATAAKKQ